MPKQHNLKLVQGKSKLYATLTKLGFPLDCHIFFKE